MLNNTNEMITLIKQVRKNPDSISVRELKKQFQT